jgi:hypothetical protein
MIRPSPNSTHDRETTMIISPASTTVMRNTWRCTQAEYSGLRTRQRSSCRVGLRETSTMKKASASHTAVRMSEPMTSHLSASVTTVLPLRFCGTEGAANKAGRERR